jgi:hypothetical protein
VSSYYIYVCAHTSIYLCSYYYIYVLLLLHLCPHPAIYVSSSCDRATLRAPMLRQHRRWTRVPSLKRCVLSPSTPSASDFRSKRCTFSKSMPSARSWECCRCSVVYLLYWCKSTNTDAAAAAGGGATHTRAGPP